MTRLQVMICTFGKEGIARVTASSHPIVDGVEYLVGWQLPDGDAEIPMELIERPDFHIFKEKSRGLSRNRNLLLSKATAPILLISDDDVDYTSEQLIKLIDEFDRNPDYGLMTFKYDSVNSKKDYPDNEFDLDRPAKGYFPTSFEIAFRIDILRKGILFNELFGIGAEFPSGEEDVFLYECLKNGIKGKFVPMIICRHDGTTTSERDYMKCSYIQTKGAVFSIIRPCSWPLRMIVHALRKPFGRSSLKASLSYIREWLKGVSRLRSLTR